MKILLIHHSKALGGGTLSLLDIAYILTDLGHEIEIMLPPGNSLAKSLIEEKGFNLYDNNNEFLTFHYYQGGPNIFRLIFRAIKHFKKKRKLRIYWEKTFSNIDHDIVILNSVVLWPMLKYARNIAKIQFIRETIKGKPNSAMNNYIRKKLSRADFTTFLSNHDLKSWNVSNNKIVMPDILNKELFIKPDKTKDELREKYHIDKSDYVFLFTGGFNKLKGIHILLDAFSEIYDQKILLLIIGDTGVNMLEKKGISKYINLHNINFIRQLNKKVYINKDNVIVIGNVKDPSVFYSICDIVIFPAIKAHQARPLYEAGYYSKPAILPEFDNYKEYLVDNYNGFYFRPGDAKDLHKIILKCVKNFSHCKKLGENNKQMTEKYHGYSYGKNIMKSIIDNIEENKKNK